ncbi:MBL fold metallo-hydrolase [Micromonospora carbonacea]|uniref:MBL fold metallo-hydrolase n=1 Tax=Micromonospora carbonacea TaxID=47853 RepID=A0A7H8XT24_9ACTN|nr:MBL fold metallo-hydrolase [Micromonospora carbonacea]MBB5830160.1 Cft2 family RNA processing exonuclease [Micromonospora carbonacea]QLD27925.1 MBL fold metallo-hydrolase [Micromonospora carbonacea]
MTDRATAVAAALPEPVRAVLLAAAQVVSRRAAEQIVPERVVAEPAGVTELLRLVECSAGLRAAVRASLPVGPVDGLAAQLTAADPGTAARGALAVRRLLDDARRGVRREARQAARAERPDLDQRKGDREARRLAEARAARDRARAAAAHAEAEAAALRARLADLTEDVATLTGRAEAAEARLVVARRATNDPTLLAAALAAALAPAPVAGRAVDQRGVGPGEPQRVDPARGVTSVMRDPDRWAAAARTAGLPADQVRTVDAWLPVLLGAYAAPPRPVSRTVDLGLRVDVLGGGQEIGASCVLVTAGGVRLLVDAGSRPGGTDAGSLAPPRIAEALADRIDAVVVTHAHNDHAGWVPALLRQQPHVPVLATEATAALLATMWHDTAKVLTRRGAAGVEGASVTAPAYTHDDVRHALSRLTTTAYGQRRRVGVLDVELFPAGHIVGAAGVVVHAGDRRVVVSGDVSRSGQLTVGGVVVPESARGADLLLLESTYAGAGRLTPRDAAIARFVADVAAVTSGGGRVLIPAFALGRAQEAALVLAEHLPDVDVVIDGLARDVATVYEQFPGPEGAPLRIFGARVRAVPPGGTRAELARLRTGVVIATSGMLTAGPALTWARELLPDASAGLMVVGYQDEDSPGGRLLALADAGGGRFELPGSGDDQPATVEVAAHIGRYGLGAHASADELVTIAADIGAAEVMLVHGEPRGQAAFAARLRLRGQATVRAGAWRPPESVASC